MVGLTGLTGLTGPALTPLLAEAPRRLLVDFLRAAPAATADPTLWYLTRALGTAAYLLLTLSVALGMLRSIARKARERLSWVVDELHQVTATLAALLVLGHLVALLLDPYLPFSASNLLLPLSEPYRPLAVRLGVLAVYGMALVLFSSWLRRRIPHRLWRGLHFFSFLAFALATAHGFLAGSDADEPWMRGIYAGAAAAIAFLTLMRIGIGPSAATKASDV